MLLDDEDEEIREDEELRKLRRLLKAPSETIGAMIDALSSLSPPGDSDESMSLDIELFSPAATVVGDSLDEDDTEELDDDVAVASTRSSLDASESFEFSSVGTSIEIARALWPPNRRPDRVRFEPSP